MTNPERIERRRGMKQGKKWTAALAALLAVSLAACSGSTAASSSESTAAASSTSDIVNVGVTSSLSSLNPLLIGATEVDKYAQSLEFLPLVELNANNEFDYMLADSITTDDNLTFKIHINADAKWSDGQPVTASDLEFTLIRLASPVIANYGLDMSAMVGTSDDTGFLEEGATSAEGVKVVDDKTLTLTMKYPFSMVTFLNSYGRYIETLPKHILGDVAESDLSAYEWFNAPTVVDGPYQATAVDNQHYISYDANASYWKGAPKISKLNIQVVDPAKVLAGLQSGELDFVQQTMAAIPQEDYAGIEALSNVKAVYGDPITTQSMFINTQTVSDVRVRQAIQLAIDRKGLLQNLLNGKGEVDEGFLTSASPYYDSTLQPLDQDVEKAKQLLADAGWDSNKELTFNVWSGDSTFVNGSAVVQQELAAVGIKVNIKLLDLNSLMAAAGNHEFDLMAVQYTYAPIDPYPDVTWLLGGETSWTGYESDAVDQAMNDSQTLSDTEAVKKEYRIVDDDVQQNVPMINLYVISALGAVSNRLVNATPTVFGFFNNIQDWEIQK